MTIRLRGALADRVRGLLGGKNLTERRVEDLLTELAERRAAERAPQPDGTRLMAPPSPPPAFLEGPEPDAADPREAALTDLLATVKALKAEVEALTAGPPMTVEQAQAVGKVPMPGIGAPPKGSGDLPRGEWFTSPFGPQVQMKLCACDQCEPHRIAHYFCVVCHGGPYAIQAQRRPFTKQWMAPGGFWGVSHYTCPNPQCQQMYLAQIGAVAGTPLAVTVNGALQAPAVPRPVVPVGSD